MVLVARSSGQRSLASCTVRASRRASIAWRSSRECKTVSVPIPMCTVKVRLVNIISIYPLLIAMGRIAEIADEEELDSGNIAEEPEPVEEPPKRKWRSRYED